MKLTLLAALLVSTLATGCFHLPIHRADSHDAKPAPAVRPEPVKADEINADNAWDKALQLHRELDYVEGKGEPAK